MIKQLDLFADELEEFKIDKPIRLIEFFSGMQTQFMALKRLGVNVVSWFTCEFDKYAVACANAMHDLNNKTSDIRNVKGGDLSVKECDKYCYMLTYSFP